MLLTCLPETGVKKSRYLETNPFLTVLFPVTCVCEWHNLQMPKLLAVCQSSHVCFCAVRSLRCFWSCWMSSCSPPAALGARTPCWALPVAVRMWGWLKHRVIKGLWGSPAAPRALSCVSSCFQWAPLHFCWLKMPVLHRNCFLWQGSHPADVQW